VLASLFHDPSHFAPEGKYQLLPFHFVRLEADRYILTNLVGEYTVLERSDLAAFIAKELSPGDAVYRTLKARHFLFDNDNRVALDLLALKYRTRTARLADLTGLHIFVVTLRCDHSCHYCQVSRQMEDRTQYDMRNEHADLAVDFAFSSPSPTLKLEFQGGEPLLNFELIRRIVERAKAKNREYGKDLQFVIASNLTHLNREVLDFCKLHRMAFSTSLDGPEDLHNTHRTLHRKNSHQATIEGIQQIVDHLGPHSISALMTTSQASLPRVRDIVDEYVQRGFHSIFLRGISPYGFASRSILAKQYSPDDWIRFYIQGLDYILELNRSGYPMREEFASILLQKMFCHGGTGYVDLQSPAGLAIAGIVYNYDGSIYASDEGRMLAEMGDQRFRIGDLMNDTFESAMNHEGLFSILQDTMTESMPMCSDCAFQPWCGADPTFHHATLGDYVGHKAFSTFCRKQMAIFRYLIHLIEDVPTAREVLLGWV